MNFDYRKFVQQSYDFLLNICLQTRNKTFNITILFKAEN